MCSTSFGTLVLIEVILNMYMPFGIKQIQLKNLCYCSEPPVLWGIFVLSSFFLPLVSRVHSRALDDKDVISREDHELETEKLELEIQQCKEMIKTQQQLLQVAGFNFFLNWVCVCLICHFSPLNLFLLFDYAF